MRKREIKITAYQCTNCGKIHYPFHDRCICCKGRQFEAIKPQGKARLLTYSQINNLPWGFDQRFLTIGVVEFENGVRAMGQIVPGDGEQVPLGAVLQASWEPVRVAAGENVYGLKLRPVSES
jgi:uncharacterized OB-fold protein